MSELPSLPGRGIKPLVSLRAHPRLAVVSAVIVLLMGIPYVWFKGKPRYMTEAVIQVSPRYMKNLREDRELDFQSNTQYRQYVQHTQKSVTRHDVLTDALASLMERRTLWQLEEETDRRAIDRLRAALIVAAVPDTYLVRIALEGGKKEGLAEVVNAVTQTFLKRMKLEEIYGSEDRARQLQQREKELLDIIARKAGKRSLIARDLGLTTFNEGTPNPYDKLVASLRARAGEARQRRFDTEAALTAFRGHADTNISVRSVSDAVLNDPGLNSLKAALFKRRADLLVAISGLTADHPQRLAANLELDEINQELARQTDSLRDAINHNLSSRLAGTAEQARLVERSLTEELRVLEGQATRFATLFQQAMQITAELSQTRQEAEKIRDRLSYLQVEANSLGFLRLVTPALVPDQPFGAGRKKLLLLVLVAMLGAAVVVPIACDLLDKRLYTANDVEGLMGIPPAGWQIERTDAATEIFAVEQLRRMASSLVRAHDTASRSVFGFTGIKPGVGTTTLVLDIGRTLQSLGFKVLLVEANGFSRDKRFDTGRPGLLELLRENARFDEVIGECSATNPARVTIGGSGAEQIPRLDFLNRTVEQWSHAFDFVLVDMPPLLSAADAELLARTLGNTLLVVQAGRTEKGELMRARRMLQKIDPDSVGVIVNRIVPFVGGGYLKEQIVESVAGRSASDFFNKSAWRLRWQTWRLQRRNS